MIMVYLRIGYTLKLDVTSQVGVIAYYWQSYIHVSLNYYYIYIIREFY